MQPRDKALRLHLFFFALLLVVLGLGHSWVNPWLGFDRSAIAQGQLWRLVTCHLVHLNGWHMLLNLTGLVLCGYFFEDLLDRRRFWLWWLSSSVLVGVSMYLLDEPLRHYVGLSGLLYGLLVMCLLIGWCGNPVLHSVVLMVVAGRLIMEQRPGYDVNYLRDWIDGSVYVNAHLYGAISGLLLAAALALVHQYQHRPRQE